LTLFSANSLKKAATIRLGFRFGVTSAFLAVPEALGVTLA
jgi:hypothetical protein